MLAPLLSLLVAQTPTAWRLIWNAPTECSQADAIKRATEMRLGQTAFHEPAERLVRGEVVRDGAGWKVSLDVLDAGGSALGQREVTSADARCSSLDSRVVLVLALLIQPSGRDTAPPLPSVPAPSPELPPLASSAPLLTPVETVRLTVESNNHSVRIFEVRTGRATSAERGWTGTIDVCGGRCGATVRRNANLLVGGPNILAQTFSLGGVRSSSAKLVVEAASASTWLLSVLGLSVSVPGITAGVVGLVITAQGANGSLIALAAGLTALSLAILVPSLVGVQQKTTVTVQESDSG